MGGMTPPTPPSVTVVVPVRNGFGCLPALLKALRAQTVDPGLFEVIVVDDCSTDDTPELVEASGFARLATMERQGGSYAARNAGLALARADVLAFTDADCVPTSTWIEYGLASLRDSGADLLAGRIDVPLGERPTAAELLGMAKHHLDQEHHVVQNGYGATANLWVKGSVFEQAGPFDPSMVSGGDGEFCRRATAAGARLGYDPAVVVTHPPRATMSELVRKQFRIGFGVAQLRRREDEGTAPALWNKPGAYIPRARIRGLDLVEQRGYRLSGWQRVRVASVQYLGALSLALGDLTGALHNRVAHSERVSAAR